MLQVPPLFYVVPGGAAPSLGFSFAAAVFGNEAVAPTAAAPAPAAPQDNAQPDVLPPSPPPPPPLSFCLLLLIP